RAAGVGDDAAAHEHLDEAGRVGHDDEVAGEDEVGAAAGRGAVDGGDHRLLTVEDGGDEPLPAAADGALEVAERPLGRALRPRWRRGLGPAEAGAGAEVAVAGAGQHDGAHADGGRQLVERVGQAVPHLAVQRVAGVRPVDGDGGDAAVVHLAAHAVDPCSRARNVGNPGPSSVYRVSTTVEIDAEVRTANRKLLRHLGFGRVPDDVGPPP